MTQKYIAREMIRELKFSTENKAKHVFNTKERNTEETKDQDSMT